MKTGYKFSGVSVIVCCFNSADRIAGTLSALAIQQVGPGLPVEIILVDNASSDDTTGISRQIWSALNAPFEMSIVIERNAGLANARKKGIETSRYNLLVFCDDDNSLCNDYISRVHELMVNHPEVAGWGGHGVPVFEGPVPSWFSTYQECYAVGAQDRNPENGQIMTLYGAGLAIRKNAFDELLATGFESIFLGRTGSSLSSSEDTELTYAFRMMGYQLRYDSNLIFYHHLPGRRLTWSYLKKLHHSFGTDGPVRNLYHAQCSAKTHLKYIKNWNAHFVLALSRLVKYLVIPPKKNGRLLYFSWSWAYLNSLLAIRNDYKRIIRNMEKIGSRRGKSNLSVSALSPNTDSIFA